MSGGLDDHVERLLELRPPHDLRLPVFVRLGLRQAQGGHLLAPQHLHHRSVEKKSAGVGLGQFIFVLVGRHVVLAPAVNDDRFLGAEPLGLGDRVNRGVATTDHRHPCSHRNLVECLGVNPANEFQGLDDPFFILPGNAQTVCLAESDPEEQGIEILHQFRDGNIFADLALAAELHP